MKDPQLLRLPRNEKKHFVRGWNASIGALAEPNPAQHPSAGVSASMTTMAVSPPPFIQQVVTASTPVTSRSIDTASNSEALEQQPETLPLTVWHVRHSYRARARRVEHASALKAADAVRGSRERSLAVNRRSLEAKPSAKATTMLDQDPALLCEYQESPTADAERDAGLDKLSASRVSLDAAYRDELLGAIRRRLAAGQSVTLRADGRDSASDARLALQLLCSLSLLHCARDQGVTPAADGALELRPRARTR